MKSHETIVKSWWVGYLQSVVIAAGHNSVAGELKAGDHMVIVTLQHLQSQGQWKIQGHNLHLGTPDRVDPPVHLNVVLPHETRLPGRVDKPCGDLAPPPAVPAI